MPATIRVSLRATWTRYSSPTAPDVYRLAITRRNTRNGVSLSRSETFQFKRTQGRGRRITISGEQASAVGLSSNDEESAERTFGIRRMSSGLSTLPRLSPEEGGAEVAALARRLASFRIFDVDVAQARRASRLRNRPEGLADDAANLAAFLLHLRERDADAWTQLVEDIRAALPQVQDLAFEYPFGPASAVAVALQERGLRTLTQLSDASFGTVRLLGLLALLHDPEPPALTRIEEIDHGLHPQALELLVERLRDASDRTQFLIATHSPALVDRLRPEELVICERRSDGSSAIPAISSDRVRESAVRSQNLPLGELWFSGGLGGDL